MVSQNFTKIRLLYLLLLALLLSLRLRVFFWRLGFKTPGLANLEGGSHISILEFQEEGAFPPLLHLQAGKEVRQEGLQIKSDQPVTLIFDV